MKKKWTSEETAILDKIEAKLIAKGVPEHQARLCAEIEFERCQECVASRRELHKAYRYGTPQSLSIWNSAVMPAINNDPASSHAGPGAAAGGAP